MHLGDGECKTEYLFRMGKNFKYKFIKADKFHTHYQLQKNHTFVLTVFIIFLLIKLLKHLYNTFPHVFWLHTLDHSFYFFKTTPLRYNSHVMQLTHLKGTSQWFLSTITAVSSRKFLLPPKRNPVLLAVMPLSPPTLSAPGNH